MEIERKFLVDPKVLHEWNRRNGKLKSILRIEQGYLSSSTESLTRVRISDNTGYLTVKSKTVGISRQEFEYEIPKGDANQMLTLCPKKLTKMRYNYEFDGMLWEVDFFKGDNQGLIVAEVELESEDQEINLPPWVTKEVSDDYRYGNNNLINNPYKDWKDA